MVDQVSFKVGEFDSQVRFYSTPERLLEGVQLAVFDTNTQQLVEFPAQQKLSLPNGEEHKVWPQIDRILTAALENSLARDSTIAGVGGGVVTDMVAFAASLYMRGCKLVLVPTTLLAMVDAALGGKTGIDYHGFKNMVGTFYPAQEVRVCPALLTSLPQREFVSGLAEVIKHSLLGEDQLWKLLVEKRTEILAKDPQILDELVYRAIMVKVRVVEKDFRETGERAFLNLGHTFGHALETAAGFDGSWAHGEAVAWGIARALDLSVRLGHASKAYFDEVVELLTAYGYRLTAPGIKAETIFAAMKNDKKKKAGAVRFVLQKARGQTFQEAVEDGLVLEIIQRGL